MPLSPTLEALTPRRPRISSEKFNKSPLRVSQIAAVRRLNSTAATAESGCCAGSIHGKRAARIIANKLQQQRRRQRQRPQQQQQQQPLGRWCARVVRARRSTRGATRSFATISSSSGATSALSLPLKHSLLSLSLSLSSSVSSVACFHSTLAVLCVLCSLQRLPAPDASLTDRRCRLAAPSVASFPSSAAPETHLPSSVDRRPTLGRF